ncbi:hypothetical protein Barb6XT_00281 [Bacteroidales bacterium Barb6XT]|nr:hypothetical protein Barb6XT_00281 [Bacteroidales bacterium Barb6XT]
MIKKIYCCLKEACGRADTHSLKGKVVFWATGTVATVWFLVRVVPKPSRAAYPCMQAAAPLMSAFVVYLLATVGGVASWHWLKKNRAAHNYGGAALCALLLAGCVSLFWANSPDTALAKTLRAQAQADVKFSLPANQPVGEAQGIFPGRVVWSHAPGAATWEEGNGNWFEDRFNSPADCDWLINKTLLNLTNTASEKEAWEALFTHHNEKHGKTGTYVKGQKVAVKINQNNTYSHDDSPEINATPFMVLSLLTSLVNEAGIPQEDITIAEPSRFITKHLYNTCYNRFPNVNYVDNVGNDGRQQTEYDMDALHYSKDNGPLAQGLSTVFTKADYVINMALLKGHEGQGVTLCGKCWYGTTSIHHDWRNNHHNNFNQDQNGTPSYLTFVDFMGHKALGEKTIVYFIDAVFACDKVNGAPTPKWKMEPFNNNWPCSLFGSQDPVAIDMVGIDFLTSEFPYMRDINYSDMYLMEAALADQAPSGTIYDPEGDGIPLKSLGTAEHWNNPSDKQYSRNLGKGQGIELLYFRSK